MKLPCVSVIAVVISAKNDDGLGSKSYVEKSILFLLAIEKVDLVGLLLSFDVFKGRKNES